MCSPRGYAQNRSDAGSIDELVFENSAFHRQLVIDLPSGAG